jgi:hypothetical protein
MFQLSKWKKGLKIIEYCRLNIEYLRLAFGGSIIKKEKATRGASACAARAISTNLRPSIPAALFKIIPPGMQTAGAQAHKLCHQIHFNDQKNRVKRHHRDQGADNIAQTQR